MKNYYLAGIVTVICLVLTAAILILNSKQQISEQVLTNKAIIVVCWPFPECLDQPGDAPGDEIYFQPIDESQEEIIKPFKQEEKG